MNPAEAYLRNFREWRIEAVEVEDADAVVATDGGNAATSFPGYEHQTVKHRLWYRTAQPDVERQQ